MCSVPFWFHWCWDGRCYLECQGSCIRNWGDSSLSKPHCSFWHQQKGFTSIWRKQQHVYIYIYICTYIHIYIYIFYIRVHAQTYSETPQLSVCQKRPGCFGDRRLELSIQCTSTAAAVEIRRHGWSFSRFFNGLRENLRGTPSILPSLMGLSCNVFPLKPIHCFFCW